MTVIYEFALKQTLTGGNGEQRREQYQPHLLLGWSDTPGNPLAFVSFVALCVHTCLLGTSEGAEAGGRDHYEVLHRKMTFLEELISCDHISI